MSNYSSNQYSEDTNTPWHKIIELVPKGSRVLDIGCSSGNLGAALSKEKNCEVVGIDLNKEDVETAKKRLSAAYVKNIETDKLDSLGTFDCVIFADVIEHLIDPVATLRKIKAMLNKSGSIIFSIPNMAHMGTRLMLLEGRFEYAETGLLDKTHLHYYDRREVERIFEEAGYIIENFDWVERYIPQKILMTRLQTVGLKPESAFFEKARQVDAVAYEFIGKSTPVTKRSGARKQDLPFVSPNVPAIEGQMEQIQAIHDQEMASQSMMFHLEKEKLLTREAKLISSISWRITLPLRIVNGTIWKVRQKIRIFLHGVRRDPRLRISKRPELKEEERVYEQSAALLAKVKKTDGVKLAIIVHLYYTDTWRVLNEKISALQTKFPADLFVTLPAANIGFAEEIRKDYPGVQIIEVPNRGRDVLPFMYVASRLEKLGYEFVLKLHSKKSLHRDDGQQWFTDILDNLLPSSAYVVNSVKSNLTNKKTGIIGPSGQYVSLLVNYDANSFFLLRTLKKIFSKDVSRAINKNREEYGFFAGTMFWARLDALTDVFARNFKVADFEREGRHIDGTMAHALERIFCVVPELQGKHMFEVSAEDVSPVTYKTYNIPEWSDLHPDNKKKQNRKSAA